MQNCCLTVVAADSEKPCFHLPLNSNVEAGALTKAHSARLQSMAPTVVRDGQFRLFFFSREETRIHVHVAHPDGEAKFWLTPQVVLAIHTGLSAKQLREAQSVVEAYIEEIRNAWNHHFGG